MKRAVTGCFFGRADDGWEAKLEWLTEWTRVTPNKNGTTGWVTVLECTSSDLEVGARVKVHLCANDPCTARYSDSKYGGFPPLHFQQITELTPEPIVEESRSCGSDLPQQVPLRPGSSEPANQDATLSRVEAFHPKCGLDRHVQTPAQIEADILGRLISLAREIRRPRQYVGYSFFILFGLARRCRPRIWEGASCVDLIETFAPWALEDALCRAVNQAVAEGEDAVRVCEPVDREAVSAPVARQPDREHSGRSVSAPVARQPAYGARRRNIVQTRRGEPYDFLDTRRLDAFNYALTFAATNPRP